MSTGELEPNLPTENINRLEQLKFKQDPLNADSVVVKTVIRESVLPDGAATEATLEEINQKLPSVIGPRPINDSLAVNLPILKSTNNSTTSTLNVGQTWTGTGEDVSNFGVICVAVYSNVASVALGLEFQFSIDNVTWYTSDTYTILANTLKNYSLAPILQYFRVKYTNDGLTQATFFIETTYRQTYVKPSSHRIGDPVVADDDAEIVSAQLVGKTTAAGGSYVAVKVNPSGALTTDNTISDISAIVGQKTMANSLPVTIASNQSKFPIYLSESDLNRISFKEPLTDAFGRLRVAIPQNVYESIFYADPFTTDLTKSEISGGTATHNSTITSVVLSTTTTTNSEAIVQTREYIRYKAGRSQLVKITGSFNGAATGIDKEFGQYDDNNGFFFRLSDTTYSVVLRTSVSGSPVDIVTNQANWNMDTLDGSGNAGNPSGITLSTLTQQIWVIDYQWQGSGAIRYGFSIPSATNTTRVIYVHTIYNANSKTTPYSQTAVLPIRARIKNRTNVASTMHITCLAVDCEGEDSPTGQLRSVSNRITPRVFTGTGITIPVLSLRKKSTELIYPLQILDFNAFGNTIDDFLVEIILNGTLTGATWVANTGVGEFDVSATAITGGTLIYSNYLRGSTAGNSLANIELAKLTRDLALGHTLANVSDIVSIVMTNITNNATALAVINYRDFK